MHAQDMTITGRLFGHAASTADSPSFTFLDKKGAETISFEDLLIAVTRISGYLSEHSRPGDRILLFFPTGLQYVASFLGCLQTGVIAVPLYPPRSAHHLSRITEVLSDCGARIALMDENTMARMSSMGLSPEVVKRLHFVNVSEILASSADPPASPTAQNDLAFLQYTSGSTGKPKGVMVTHASLMANQAAIAKAFGTSRDDIVVSWLPLYHDMGLIGTVLHALYQGFHSVLISPTAFVRDPLLWLSAISRYGATIAGGPDFGYMHCVRKIDTREVPPADLSSLRLAFSGAEPIRANTLKIFAKRFEPWGFRKSAFYPFYGMAEATLFASGGPPGSGAKVVRFDKEALAGNRAVPADDGLDLVSCSVAAPEHTLCIVDAETGKPRGEREIGEILFSGPSVAAGYWNQPESAAVFRNQVPGKQGSFLKTGDLGFLWNNELFVTGRLKDLIIIRGRNLYPHDLEEAVRDAHPALRHTPGACFAEQGREEEELVVVHEMGRENKQTPPFDEIAEAVRKALPKAFAIPVHTICLVEPGAVPRTSSGKIQRNACRARFLDGKLPILHLWRRKGLQPEAALSEGHERDSVEIRLRHWLGKATGENPKMILLDAPFANLGLDSIAAFELQQFLEAEFNYAVTMEQLLSEMHLSQVLLGLSRAEGGNITAPAAPEAFIPLSYNQKALWFLDRLSPLGKAYLLVFAAELKGELPAGKMTEAFTMLVERHEVLRARLTIREDEAYLQIQTNLNLPVEEIGVEDWSPARREAYLHERAMEPIDTEGDLLWRVVLLRIAPNHHLVLMAAHHLIMDLWSLIVVLEELGALLQCGDPLPEPGRYADWVQEERRLMESEQRPRLEAFWREILPETPPFLDMITDAPRPPVQTFSGDSVHFPINPQLVGHIKDIIKSEKITAFVYFLTVFQMLLHRYSGQPQVMVGSPSAGRYSRGHRRIVGYCVNPLVLPADFREATDIRSLLAKNKTLVKRALSHRRFPFQALVEILQPDRSSGRPPLFQAMFVYQRAQGQKDAGKLALRSGGGEVDLGGLVMTPLPLPQEGAQVDISLNIAETEEGYDGVFEYNSDLFARETITRMIGHFTTLTEKVGSRLHEQVNRLDLTSDAEKLLLPIRSAEMISPDQVRCDVTDSFAQRAAKHPDKDAVVVGSERINYAALERMANQIAHGLCALGAGPEVLVGLCLERGPELIPAMLGVLKAGAAYVPMDPAYPAERLAYMRDDADSPLVLTSSGYADGFDTAGTHVIKMDTRPFAAQPHHNPTTSVHAENLSHVIYTSGSTGPPKGVALRRESISVLSAWAGEAFPDLSEHVVAATTSVCFDLSVFEILVTLCHGGTVVLAENALLLPEHGAFQEVTLVNTVPSAMNELVRRGALPSALRVANLAGEPLQGDLVAAIHQARPGIQVHNLYGPSEDTTYSTYALIPQGEISPSIGLPISETTVYLCVDSARQTGLGLPGQLMLGGRGLARGYHKRPALTADHFIPDPYGSHGGRLYRTGDQARRRPDGTLTFLGRTDRQVKYRGYRIELTEIERALGTAPSVREAAVHLATSTGSQRLCGFLVFEDGADEESSSKVKDHLHRHLPAFMVPSLLVPLEHIPLLPNGKVDRQALGQIVHANTAHGEKGPLSDTELELAQIWMDVLDPISTEDPAIGRDQDFFGLGGHSLMAFRITSKIRERFGVELSMSNFYQFSTLSAQVRRIEELKSREDQIAPSLARTERIWDASGRVYLPAFRSQHSHWTAERMTAGFSAFNMPAVLTLEGNLSPTRLWQTLTTLSERHEALRTTFQEKDNALQQVIHRELPPAMTYVDLRGLSRANALETARRWSEVEATRPFDLIKGSLLRATLAAVDNEHHELWLTFHHIICDAWSLEIFIREFGTVYGGGKAGDLPASTYADWLVWSYTLEGQRSAIELAYWRTCLSGADSILHLPYDYGRPEVASYEGASVSVLLDSECTNTAKDFARTHKISLFVLLESIFALLLAKYSNQRDILVAIPVARREHPETVDLIGNFLNTVVLRHQIDDSLDAVALLRQVRQLLVEAQENRHITYEQVLNAVNPPREPGANPLFQTMFVLQEPLASRLELSDLTITVHAEDHRWSKYDFSLFAEDRKTHIACLFEYSTSLFKPATVARMADDYVQLLSFFTQKGEHSLQDVLNMYDTPMNIHDFMDDLEEE